MKDMFYKYDNIVDDNNNYFPIFKPNETDLEFNGTPVIVKDVFNREIGVMVRHNHEFTLYFYLYDLAYMSDEQFSTLMENSSLIFEVYSGRHELMLQKEFRARDALDDTNEAFCVRIEQQEAKNLALDSYRMRLWLSWPGGNYELYSEQSGLLIVR